ncbi:MULTISPECIES: nuclear transport factor 2 family protein [unclassified Mesorhizobium]|uniref:nuclear transport factor 2 family protein n=1 Tax=unclassified Mesorhizobium TaxID=325217 RepID=UPI00046607D5|nr:MULTISPECIES: nuclear transport factor 2 family protein [unclassified Mesorhizobium]
MVQSETDRQQVIEAVTKYAWGYDQKDFGLLGEAMAINATSGGKITGTDVTWGPMKSRDEVVSGLQAMRNGQTMQPRHCLGNFLFSRQSDSSASLRCYLTLLASEGGRAGVATTGYFDIDAVKEGNVWRISRLDVTLDAPF